MKILVCGSRNYKKINNVEHVIKQYPQYTKVIHGDCKGVDRLAGEAANKLGMEVIIFPADWDKYGKSAGIIRNQQMLNEGKPDRVIAFWDGESKGTKNMITIARKAGIPIEVKK